MPDRGRSAFRCSPSLPGLRPRVRLLAVSVDRAGRRTGWRWPPVGRAASRSMSSSTLSAWPASSGAGLRGRDVRVDGGPDLIGDGAVAQLGDEAQLGVQVGLEPDGKRFDAVLGSLRCPVWTWRYLLGAGAVGDPPVWFTVIDRMTPTRRAHAAGPVAGWLGAPCIRWSARAAKSGLSSMPSQSRSQMLVRRHRCVPHR